MVVWFYVPACIVGSCYLSGLICLSIKVRRVVEKTEDEVQCYDFMNVHSVACVRFCCGSYFSFCQFANPHKIKSRGSRSIRVMFVPQLD